jgi:hypothetical protein
VPLAGARVREHSHEQALSRDQPLPGAEQRPHDALPLLAPVAEHRFHFDAGGHVHHRARLGDRALAGIELDLDELHFIANDSVINHVHHVRHSSLTNLRIDEFADCDCHN